MKRLAELVGMAFIIGALLVALIMGNVPQTVVPVVTFLIGMFAAALVVRFAWTDD